MPFIPLMVLHRFHMQLREAAYLLCADSPPLVMGSGDLLVRQPNLLSTTHLWYPTKDKGAGCMGAGLTPAGKGVGLMQSINRITPPPLEPPPRVDDRSLSGLGPSNLPSSTMLSLIPGYLSWALWVKK